MATLEEQITAEKKAAAAREAEERRLKAEVEARLKAENDALDAQEAAVASLHAQANAVLNIKAIVPVVLDKSANNFSRWRGLSTR